jgi:hypothetical protein
MEVKLNIVLLGKWLTLFVGLLYFFNPILNYTYEFQFFVKATSFYSGVALFYMFYELAKASKYTYFFKGFFLVAIMILNNPFFVIHLGSQSAWIAPNILSGLYFIYIYHGLTLLKTNKPN